MKLRKQLKTNRKAVLYKKPVRILVYGFFVVFAVSLFSAQRIFSKQVVKSNEIAEWKLFTNLVDSYVNLYKGCTGVLIRNFKNNLSYEYNCERKFISASLIKMPIMCAVYRLAGENELSLNHELTLKKKFRVGGAGKLKYAGANSKYSIAELVRIMIKDSDNTAAKMIAEHIGYKKLNNCFVDMGLLNTNISPNSFCMNRRYVADESYTTPEDMAFLLEKVYKGEFIDEEISGEIVGILKTPDKKNRLGRYMPEDFELAHKTGLLRGACHDAGIVFTPAGDYIICVMTEENRSYKTAKKFISNIAKLAFQTI